MVSIPAAEDKTALRPVLLARRREIVAGRDREADAQSLAAHVLALVAELGLGPGDTVAAYESMRTEPPLAASIDALAAHGIRVLVPVTLPDNDLDWCDASDPARMPAGPDALSAAGLVLTPGLSADRTGTRLGRGGGSYDRALARRAEAARVVVVLHPGEVSGEPLPRDDHDLPVDGVLTADGTEWF
ncbi:5-formyltetrahydrofolate cyclo-ligase [Rothia sp. ARF10]|nr:5-formyltetrahydrofolate cyclo-ligase [Rothia sp. ARF10]